MIILKNISFGYEKNSYLYKDLNLDISPGKIYGMLGKNGAGKTTLLKIITGLRKQSQGSCEVFGQIPSKRNLKFLEQIFLVPEEIPSPKYTIGNYVRLFSDFYKSFNHTEMKQYLSDFDLDVHMHLDRISYGQRKKFFLAFALASGTNLVLFDEPTNGLDIPSKSIFRKLTASTITDEKTYIISTHQVRDLNMLIDHVIFLDKGRIKLDSSINEISTDYSFVTLPTNHNEKNIIYLEQHLDGIRAIIPNKKGLETNVDLELLFSAVVFDKILT